MNKKINEDLLQAFGEMVPKDFYQRIEQNIALQERTVQMNKKINLKALQRAVIGIAATLILVFGGVFGLLYYGENYAVDSLVDIDVNPGIELSLNMQERVLKAEAINEDAQEILKDMDLKNTDLNVAINAIIGSMVQKGYLDLDLGGNILISVQNDSAVKADQLKQKINEQVHSILQDQDSKVSILNQVVEKKSDAESFAATHKISLGKAVFILNLAKKDPTLKAEELAAKSLKEIAVLVKEKNLNISDIVDYDADDSLWENIADEIEDTNEDQQESQEQKPAENKTDSAPSYIGAEKAKSIALKHAGLSSARFEKAELDREGGAPHYELEFATDSAEYEYEIHAESGKILFSEKERKESAKEPVAESKPANNAPSYIGAEKAKSIALKHAGLSAAEVRFDGVELDRDDSVAKYEIEFQKGNAEYSYEIRAADGKILDFEKDLDD